MIFGSFESVFEALLYFDGTEKAKSTKICFVENLNINMVYLCLLPEGSEFQIMLFSFRKSIRKLYQIRRNIKTTNH